MAQPTLFDASLHLTVTELTRHLRRLFEKDAGLRDVWVQGEISNLSRPASGHVYFTLKDAGAALRCVIWKTDASRQPFTLQDGLQVDAHGRIDIYEANGQYQLYVDMLQRIGEGSLYQEFLRLKAVLEAQGLFDPARKRPIPAAPASIGVITSATGASLRDILTTLRRRMPLLKVVLAATPVQGEEAPAAIVHALQEVNRLVAPEVILLARGGGSIEDLWAFNDERVVRAIAESRSPVITGIGHETDFTLADFAADLRAPTPTGAAELATGITAQDLQAGLVEAMQRLQRFAEASFTGRRSQVMGLLGELRFYNPERRVLAARQRLDEVSRRGTAFQSHRLALEASRLEGMQNRLSALNPQGVLSRGYSIVRKGSHVVASRSQVMPGNDLVIRVKDGEYGARVTGEG